MPIDKQHVLTAEEGSKTKKIREKLRRRLREMDRSVTPQALERKSREIHRWICLHASHRVILKSKAMALFDGNRNTAKLSQKASQLALRLKESFIEGNVSKSTERCRAPLAKSQGLLE